MLSDEQLALRIAEGDRAAFGVLYERHLPILTRYCRRILRVQEDAEDAAQSAMLAALRSLPGRPPKLKLQAWLFRVAHNEAVSVLRRTHAHQPLEAALEVHSPAVTETAALRGRVREVVSDMQALPERQRTALVLRELCGHDYHEIGGMLGCSEAAVMQTVFEARRALTQCEEGRTLSCRDVQKLVSGGDRRSLRARRVRAHLRGCDLCRGYALTAGGRRFRLALLGPFGVFKLALAAVVGTLRSGEGGRRARWAELAGRLQGASPGVRSAAASVLLATGGGVTAVGLAHHARPVPKASSHHVAAKAVRADGDTASALATRSPVRHLVVRKHAAAPAAAHRQAASPVPMDGSNGTHRRDPPRWRPATSLTQPPATAVAGAGPGGESARPAPVHVVLGGPGGVQVTAGSGGIKARTGAVDVQLHAGLDGVQVSTGVGDLHVVASLGAKQALATVAGLSSCVDIGLRALTGVGCNPAEAGIAAAGDK